MRICITLLFRRLGREGLPFYDNGTVSPSGYPDRICLLTGPASSSKPRLAVSTLPFVMASLGLDGSYASAQIQQPRGVELEI